MKRILFILLALLLAFPAQAEVPATIDFGTDLCAAAYIGYGEDIGSVLRDPETAPLMAMHPFLATIPAMDTVVLPGHEVYCIVPAQGVTLIVEALDTASEAYPAMAQEVWRGTTPVLIICNESDIMPNVQVRIVSERGEAVFTPYMSLRDGSFSAHAPDDGVADFTLYPEGFIFEE